jgi:sulfur-oxidizing protein SoxB
MELDGKPIDASKTYKVAGWASVAQPLEGNPIWDAVADYLRDIKTVRVDSVNDPKLINVEGNPGIA